MSILRPKITPRFLKRLSNLLILSGILLLVLTYYPVIRDEVWYDIKSKLGSHSSSNNAFAKFKQFSAFADILFQKPASFRPVNRNFAIVIEKIGVNAPIKADVPVMDAKAYNEALREGVAHAAVSSYPSTSAGNVYLFAHTSLNFWQLGKYATTFNLLRKLEVGDTVHVFYKGDDFVYKVAGKEVVKGWNTYPLTRPTIEPILTLQTCDPPGTTLNRLVVTAKLSGVNLE